MGLSRRGYLLTVLAAAIMALLAPQLPLLWIDLTGPGFPEALAAAGSLLALALSGWVLTIAALVMLGVSSHGLTRLTPAVLRGVLLAGAAGALAAGPAQAHQGSGVEAHHDRLVAGLPLPDRPDTSMPSARVHAPRTITVRPGDSLWAIASRSLPGSASDAQIAVATRAWHRANREVIGADPHLIFPTQRLTPPTVKDLP